MRIFSNQLYQIVQTLFTMKKPLTFHKTIFAIRQRYDMDSKGKFRKNVVLIFTSGMGNYGAPRGFGDLGKMAIYFQGAGEHW